MSSIVTMKALSIFSKPPIISGINLYTFKNGHIYSILPINILMARDTIGCRCHENFKILGFQSIFSSYSLKLISVNIECQKPSSILNKCVLLIYQSKSTLITKIMDYKFFQRGTFSSHITIIFFPRHFSAISFFFFCLCK